MKKMLAVLFALLWIIAPGWTGAAEAAPERPYRGIALIGDPHLPGRELPAKEELIRAIDGWDDVDRVVVLGDICKETGTAREYAFAKKFFGRLKKPVRLIAGNHDYIYEDEVNSEGRKVRAAPALRQKKLALFAQTFGQQVYGEERLGGYLLVYLSPDDLEADRLTQLSEERLAWLKALLAGHRDLPTIVFFHAPLAGTLKPYNERVDTASFVAQPAERLAELIRENPQLFLWVAGHLHVPATNESYSAPVNLYDGRVTVIHNSDLERKRAWTNVLHLYRKRVVVRTYDHGLKSWRPDLERQIRPPVRPNPR